MDTEPSRFVGRRGVAMFVVLGTIIVVTLLGFVGLTMAGKDQSQSGDFADLKSTDQVGLAGLQLAINRLTANPANMVTQLNAFITDSRAHASNVRSWLNLTGTNVAAVTTNPGWDYLSTTTGDQSAVEVQILAVASGPDTAAVPAQDSEAIYVALLCNAKGRHGDLRTVQGTYLVHGVSLAFTQSIGTYVLPKYAFYLGGQLSSNNLAGNVTGDVYIGGVGGSLNGNSALTIQGMFKCAGNYSTNAATTIDSNAFISGSLNTNGSAPLTVTGNLGMGNGFSTMNSTVTVNGNFWVGGQGDANSWSSGDLIVHRNMVFWPSGEKVIGGKIHVDSSLWLMSGLQKQNFADSVRALYGSIYLADSSTVVPFNFTLVNSSGMMYAGLNFVSSTTKTLSFGATPTKCVDSLYIAGTADRPSITAALANAGYVNAVTNWGSIKVGGTTYNSGPPPTPVTHAKAVPAPSAVALGLDTNIQNVALANNVMDTIRLSNVSGAAAKMVELSYAYTAAGMTTGPIDFSPTSLNKLYHYMDSTKQTYNGYMVLNMNSTTGSLGFNDDNTGTTGGFTGKALFVVDGSFNVNGGWPHSHDSTDIQIIDVRGNSGVLSAWGWKSGNFSGIFYWENPPCGSQKLQLPSTGTWWGGFIMGTNSTNCATGMSGSDGSVQLIKSNSVYMDIGTNLPGLIKPGVNANGTSSSSVGTVATTTTSPFLRQVTDKPFFESIGVYR